MFKGRLNFIFCRFNSTNLLLFITTIFILLAKPNTLVEINIKIYYYLGTHHLGIVVIFLSNIEHILVFYLLDHIFRTLLFICVSKITFI